MRRQSLEDLRRHLHAGPVAEGDVSLREETAHPGFLLRQRHAMGIGIYHQELAFLLDGCDDALDDRRTMDVVKAQPHHVERLRIHTAGAGGAAHVLTGQDGERGDVRARRHAC